MKIIAVMGLALALVGCPSTGSPDAADVPTDAPIRNICNGDMCASMPGTVCCDGLCELPEMCIWCVQGSDIADTRRDAFIPDDAGCFAR